MKILYAAVITFLVFSVLALVGTFFLLDLKKRSSYYYVMETNGRETGFAKVDRYRTEDKIIYRSVLETPADPVYRENRTRMTLEKDRTLDTYSRDRYAKQATETRQLFRRAGRASFLSRFDSSFSFLEGLAIKTDSFVFDELSPVTYLPILENYDLSKGGTQGFNGLVFPKEMSLPPAKKYIALTSIRDEDLEIDGRQFRTENLVLRIRNFPSGNVWISKSDKSLVRAEIPSIGLRITRALTPRKIELREYAPSAVDLYASRETSFTNKKTKLSGTLSVPEGAADRPGVLLVWGEGPQDRNYQGLFSSMANGLASAGFVVLRFDKRGTGSSEGDAGALSEKEEAGDISAAIEHLASQKEVAAGQVAVIAHSKGARTALIAASDNRSVRCLVLMAPGAGMPTQEARDLALLKVIAPARRWTDEYLKSAETSIRSSYARAAASRHDWGYVLGKLCFTKRMKDSMEDISGYISMFSAPVLILYGNQDDVVDAGAITELDNAIKLAEKAKCTITYYSYIGHFFGRQVSDGVHKTYYEADRDVLEGIKSWLELNVRAEEAK